MHHWVDLCIIEYIMHNWVDLCIIEYTDASLNILMHYWIYWCIIEYIYASLNEYMHQLGINWIYASWNDFMHRGMNLCIVEWIYASTLTYLPVLCLSSSMLSVHVLLLLRVIDDLWMCRHMGWQSQMTSEHVMMCCRWLVNASSQWVPDDLRMCRDGCRWLINTPRVVYCELFVAGCIYFVSWMTFEHVMMYYQRLVNASSYWVPDDFWTCHDGCRWLINTSRVAYCELFVAGFIYFVSWMAFEHVMMYCRRLMNASSRWISDDLWTCRDVCRCLINTSRVAFCMTYSSLDLLSLCLVDDLWTYHAIVSSDYEYVMGCFLRDLFVERIVYSTLIIAFYWCIFKNYWLILLQDLL